MKKLTLQVESLVVESFDTSRMPAADRGTVRGRDSWTEPQEPDTIVATCGCPPPNTGASCGAASCQWSCDPGCTATCGAATCNQTCPNTCYICGPQEPQ
jgi:hypothetical protein